MDSRQAALTGGVWTLGSIKELSEVGTEALTYYQTVGSKGIIAGGKTTMIYPMYYVFAEILKHNHASLLTSRSSHPRVFEGIVLEHQGQKTMILANLTGEHIVVGIEGMAENARIKKLDEKSMEKAMYHHEEFMASPFCTFKFEQPVSNIKIRPYGLVFISE
ncbi:MAG: hypothetical protein HC819_13860 [Cyclobacteriaceae bacterium]|nr:hypothetical protein [Cyclobacteriaceae bacterium]